MLVDMLIVVLVVPWAGSGHRGARARARARLGARGLIARVRSSRCSYSCSSWCSWSHGQGQVIAVLVLVLVMVLVVMLAVVGVSSMLVVA